MHSIDLVPPENVHLLHDFYIQQLHQVDDYLTRKAWTNSNELSIRFVSTGYNEQLKGYWELAKERIFIWSDRYRFDCSFNIQLHLQPRNYRAHDYSLKIAYQQNSNDLLPELQHYNQTYLYTLSKELNIGQAFLGAEKHLHNISRLPNLKYSFIK
jgi:hypothetical protein